MHKITEAETALCNAGPESSIVPLNGLTIHQNHYYQQTVISMWHK